MIAPNADPGGNMDKIPPSLDTSSDARYGNGIPPNLHISELDFIQMTGLTRPARMEDPAGPPETPAPPAPMPPADTSAISFFERGVLDVDHTMTDSGTEAEPARADSEVLGSTPAPPETPEESESSAEKLKEIIDALQQAMDSNGDAPDSDFALSDADAQTIASLTVPDEDDLPSDTSVPESPMNNNEGASSSPFLAVPEEPKDD